MRISRFGFHTLLFCVTVIAVFVFSGYHHTVEIQDRLLCHALGIDFSDGEYEVSAQVFKPSGTGSDTPVDITKSNIELVYGRGKTVSQALEQCENKRGKEIFLGHLQLICFGRSVDFSDAKQLFEFCLKDRTVYLGVDICLGDTSASELMEVELSNDMLATENYVSVIEKNAQKSRTVRCRLLDFLNMAQTHQCVALPVLKVTKPQGDKKEFSEPSLQISETALIKDGRVLDESIDAEKSSVFCMLCGEGKACDMVLESGGRQYSVSISRKGSSAGVEQGEGILLYKAHLEVVVHHLKDIVNDYDNESVKRLVTQKLHEQFSRVFGECISGEKADVFGVWKLLRAKYPKTFLDYKDRLDELYECTQGELEIECLVE